MFGRQLKARLSSAWGKGQCQGMAEHGEQSTRKTSVDPSFLWFQTKCVPFVKSFQAQLEAQLDMNHTDPSSRHPLWSGFEGVLCSSGHGLRGTEKNPDIFFFFYLNNSLSVPLMTKCLNQNIHTHSPSKLLLWRTLHGGLFLDTFRTIWLCILLKESKVSEAIVN